MGHGDVLGVFAHLGEEVASLLNIFKDEGIGFFKRGAAGFGVDIYGLDEGQTAVGNVGCGLIVLLAVAGHEVAVAVGASEVGRTLDVVNGSLLFLGFNGHHVDIVEDGVGARNQRVVARPYAVTVKLRRGEGPVVNLVVGDRAGGLVEHIGLCFGNLVDTRTRDRTKTGEQTNVEVVGVFHRGPGLLCRNRTLGELIQFAGCQDGHRQCHAQKGLIYKFVHRYSY